MPRASAVRQADLERSMRALKTLGLTVDRIEVRPGGQVTVFAREPGSPAEAAAQQGLTPAAPRVTPDSLEQWRAGKRARGDRAT
ncbi:MAG: hypothetical protein ACOY5Y_07220 [Pseudomonadota bacterium]